MNRLVFILPVIYTRHFEIRRSEFGRAGDLSVAARSRDWSGPYTTQKPNLSTGGTDKLFRGPWQGAVVDVIEPLNRDYPRVIGCGDTETGHSSLLLSLLFPRSDCCCCLPLSPPSRIHHKSRSVLNTASPNMCLFFFFFFFFLLIVSLLFLLPFFNFFIDGGDGVQTCFFFHGPHLRRPRGVVSGGNKSGRRAARAREREKESLRTLFFFFASLSAISSRFTWQCVEIRRLF